MTVCTFAPTGRRQPFHNPYYANPLTTASRFISDIQAALTESRKLPVCFATIADGEWKERMNSGRAPAAVDIA